jgi:hypothetical protein
MTCTLVRELAQCYSAIGILHKLQHARATTSELNKRECTPQWAWTLACHKLMRNRMRPQASGPSGALRSIKP